MSAKAVALGLIKPLEGCKLTAYLCPAGVWTIGYGATGAGIHKDVTWTQAQADERLDKDVQRFLDGVKSLLRKSATDSQLGAMVSLAYNIGLEAFKNSTLLRLFNAGDVKGAAAQFDRWVRAGGRVLAGLVRRRAAERKVFEGGK